MKSYKLNDNISVPEIAFGTFPRKEELKTIIPNAYECGFRIFDTSDDYENQSFIGEILHPYDLYSDILIETKISNWTYGPRRIKDQIKKSISELNLPEGRSIDILLLHFPYPYIFLDAWKEMEELYFSNVVKAIGVCNFTCQHMTKLLSVARVKPVLNQIELHPMFQQKEICKFCKENNIQIMSYSPVARMDKRLIENSILQNLSRKKNKSVTQIIIRWNIQHGYIPVVSSSNPKHIKENLNVYNFELEDSEMDEIDSLDCGMRIRYNPDTMFRLKDRIKYMYFHLFQ